MSDRWLEARVAIEKSAVVAGPLPPSRPSDPLATIFGVDCEEIIPVAKTAQIHDDGDTEMEIPDPVAAFFEKDERAKFRIPEIIVEPMHADGTFLEKTDGGVFKFTYERGHLVRSELFDDAGKRKGSVEESPVPDVIVKTDLAKIIGLDEVVEVEVGE